MPDSLAKKTIFKLKKLLKSKTRSLRPTIKVADPAKKPKHHLRHGVGLDAKYEDIRRQEVLRVPDIIKPRLSFLPIIDLVLKIIASGLKLAIFLAAVGGIFLGRFIWRSLKFWVTHLSFHISLILLVSVLAICSIAVCLMLIIQSLTLLENSFCTTGSSTKRSSSLETILYGLSDDEIDQVFNSLPWRLKELGVDSMEWGNQAIDVLWSCLAGYVYREINKRLDESVSISNIYSAYGLKVDLRVTRLTLGRQTPRVTGIRVFNASTSRYDDLVVQTEINYDMDGEIKVRLDVEWKGKKMCHIPLGIKGFQLRVKTELVVSPLLSRLPGVGGITLTLMEEPTFQWYLTGFLRILNPLASLIPPILYFFLRTPHPLHIELTPLYPVIDLDVVVAKVLLQVDIYEGRNIPHANPCFRSNPDAFVVIETEMSSRWTSVVKSSSNPVFNQSFTFLLKDIEKNFIRFTLYDEDIDQDVELGYVVLPLIFVQGDEYNGRNMTLPLTNRRTEIPIGGASTGLQVRMTLLPLSVDPIPRSVNAPVAPGVLTVFIDSARNLSHLPIQSLKSNELRVIVRVQVGSHVEVTKIKERTGFPIWKEILIFSLEQPNLEEISVDVYDIYKVMEKRSVRYFGRKIKETFADWKSLADRGVKLGGTILRPPFTHGLRREYVLDGILEKAFVTMYTDVRYTLCDENLTRNCNLPSVVLTKEIISSNTPVN